MPTGDGYPTETELKLIREWDYKDPHGWLDFIKTCWWSADWGWREQEYRDAGEKWRRCLVSTGGWSGNEEIVEAMRGNLFLWHLTWEEHRKGGHFKFSRVKP